jgi:hypothetical protein
MEGRKRNSRPITQFAECTLNIKNRRDTVECEWLRSWKFSPDLHPDIIDFSSGFLSSPLFGCPTMTFFAAVVAYVCDFSSFSISIPSPDTENIALFSAVSKELKWCEGEIAFFADVAKEKSFQPTPMPTPI